MRPQAVTPDAVSSSFEGSAFHPDYPEGRAGGTLHVAAGGLRFEPMGDAATFELPYPGLTMRLGGASDRLLFFSHPGLPEVSAYTSDHRILDHPHLASRADIAGQIEGVRVKKRKGHAVTASILAALVLAAVGLVALKDPLVGFVAGQVPASFEVRMGDVFFGQIRTQVDLVEDEELETALDELVAPLLASIPDTGYPFELHLADDSTLNAFAVPGGNVVVHSGLILKAETPEEVLGVLAHEIAHVTERHSLHQILSTAGVYVLFQAFFGDLTGLAAVLADGGFQLLTLEFSRDHERDADSVGFTYLVDAGIDPEGMIAFFEKLQAEQERLQGDAAAIEKSLGFLSTHPSSEERIERLTARWSDLGGEHFPSQPFDLEAFQDRIRQELSGGEEGDEQ